MDTISIAIPCYNEQESIVACYNELNKVDKELRNVNLEIIFIDDGSNDKTLSIIKSLHDEDSRVGYVSFTRNFGKEAALLAGLEQTKGEYVVVMDVDLQDPPELLPSMYEILKEGRYDCVATRRVNRKGEPLLRSFFARQFYKMINKISDVQLVDGARDYRMMKREVVDSILKLREYNRFSKGIFNWVGYRIKWLEYANQERVMGQTKWSFWKLFIYALDGITAFSTIPLAISSLMGTILFVFSFILILVIIFKTLMWGDPVNGWPSLVCIIFFVSGIQLLCIGILGQYVAKTYMETKNRPLYLIKEVKCSEVCITKEYDKEEKHYIG